jgi:hypothetical protein
MSDEDLKKRKEEWLKKVKSEGKVNYSSLTEANAQLRKELVSIRQVPG